MSDHFMTFLMWYAAFVVVTARFGVRIGRLCLERWDFLITVSCTESESREWHDRPDVREGRFLMFLLYPWATHFKSSRPAVFRWWRENGPRGSAALYEGAYERDYLRWSAWTWSLRIVFNMLLLPFIGLHAVSEFIAFGRNPRPDAAIPEAKIAA